MKINVNRVFVTTVNTDGKESSSTEIEEEFQPTGFDHCYLKEAHNNLGGGFKHFLFSPLLGEMIQFD